MLFENPRPISYSMKNKRFDLFCYGKAIWKNQEFMIENHRSDFYSAKLCIFYRKIKIGFSLSKTMNYFIETYKSGFYDAKLWIFYRKIHIWFFIMQNSLFDRKIHVWSFVIQNGMNFIKIQFWFFVMQNGMNFIKGILDSSSWCRKKSNLCMKQFVNMRF